MFFIDYVLLPMFSRLFSISSLPILSSFLYLFSCLLIFSPISSPFLVSLHFFVFWFLLSLPSPSILFSSICILLPILYTVTPLNKYLPQLPIQYRVCYVQDLQPGLQNLVPIGSGPRTRTYLHECPSLPEELLRSLEFVAVPNFGLSSSGNALYFLDIGNQNSTEEPVDRNGHGTGFAVRCTSACSDKGSHLLILAFQLDGH